MLLVTTNGTNTNGVNYWDVFLILSANCWCHKATRDPTGRSAFNDISFGTVDVDSFATRT